MGVRGGCCPGAMLGSRLTVHWYRYGDMYQLGNGDMQDEPTPFHVEANADLGAGVVIGVGAGGQHTVLLAADRSGFDAWVASPPAPPTPIGEAEAPAKPTKRRGGSSNSRAGKRRRR